MVQTWINIEGGIHEYVVHHHQDSLEYLIPEVINAVIKGLKSMGVPESDIWVIEPSSSNFQRLFYSYYYDRFNGPYLLDTNDIDFGKYPKS